MIPFDDVRTWLLKRSDRLPGMRRPVVQAAGWVLSDDVPLPVLPPAPVAAIEGLAVRASDTEGASDYTPLPLAGTPIRAGDTLPPGTDAVLPPDAFDHGPAALIATAAGSFVIPAGHDAPQGALIPAGTVLRALHLSLIARGGHPAVPVVRRPRVVLRATGQHRADGLTALITALIEAEGGLVADDPAEVENAPPPDLILLVSRSRAIISATTLEFGILHTPAEAAESRDPGIILPGAPLRCLAFFTHLVAPALRRMGGRPEPAPRPATLTRKVISPSANSTPSPSALKPASPLP